MIEAAVTSNRALRVYRVVKEAVGWTVWEDSRRLFSLEDETDALAAARGLVETLESQNHAVKIEVTRATARLATHLKPRKNPAHLDLVAG